MTYELSKFVPIPGMLAVLPDDEDNNPGSHLSVKKEATEQWTGRVLVFTMPTTTPIPFSLEVGDIISFRRGSAQTLKLTTEGEEVKVVKLIDFRDITGKIIE